MGNQGEHFSDSASRTSSLCAQSWGAAGWAGCQGGTEGLVPPHGALGVYRAQESGERFPALALPALDCRCCCLITASSPASQGSLAAQGRLASSHPSCSPPTTGFPPVVHLLLLLLFQEVPLGVLLWSSAANALEPGLVPDIAACQR